MLRGHRHFRTLLLPFLIVLLGLQTSPAFSGLNLCIGVGGHLEIEAEADDCCPSRSPLANESSLVQEEGSCTSCIDVSFGGHETNTLATSSGGSTNEVYFPAAPLLERLTSLHAVSVHPDLGLPLAPSLRAVRSVVLRV